MSQFVIRLDDICPGLHWANFTQLCELFSEHQILPLLGVVPDNRDELLVVDELREAEFWGTLRRLRSAGWETAQHGLHHVKNADDGGMLRLKTWGEFAGLDYDRQLHDLDRGRGILLEQGLDTDIFMAPQHSFDETTLRALQDLKFKYVTDGYGLYPYRFQNLIFVPQLFGTPIHLGFGVYTICIHLNNLTSERIQRLASFVSENRHRIIPFSTAAHMFTSTVKEMFLRHTLGFAVPMLRRLRDERPA